MGVVILNSQLSWFPVGVAVGVVTLNSQLPWLLVGVVTKQSVAVVSSGRGH